MKKIKNGKIGKDMKFLRLRRVTGYITGDYKSRFNDSKISETDERVKHSVDVDTECGMK